MGELVFSYCEELAAMGRVYKLRVVRIFAVRRFIINRRAKKVALDSLLTDQTGSPVYRKWRPICQECPDFDI